jgi:hypothetical protein
MSSAPSQPTAQSGASKIASNTVKTVLNSSKAKEHQNLTAVAQGAKLKGDQERKAQNSGSSSKV